jgi:predicted enzyme related to lactoylglutathione lyase
MAMPDHKRVNCIDFIEFPASSPEALAQSKRFYAEVFGWSYKDWGDDYADTHSSGLASGLNADVSHQPRSALAVIYTNDLEATLEKVRARNGQVTKEIFSFPGGRRFHFQDPSGNELAVWSDR